jgi:hypothetical protein
MSEFGATALAARKCRRSKIFPETWQTSAAMWIAEPNPLNNRDGFHSSRLWINGEGIVQRIALCARGASR